MGWGGGGVEGLKKVISYILKIASLVFLLYSVAVLETTGPGAEIICRALLYNIIIIIRAIFIQGNLVDTMSIVINKGPVI